MFISIGKAIQEPVELILERSKSLSFCKGIQSNHKRRENSDDIFVDDELYAERGPSNEPTLGWIISGRYRTDSTQLFQVGCLEITWHLLSCY